MNETSPNQPVKPKRKRRVWIFRTLALLMAYVFSEGLAGLYLQVGGGVQARISRRSKLASPVPAKFHNPDIAHPYLGFVVDPISNVNGKRLASDWGFDDVKSPLRERNPEILLIAITGGSVAEQFARHCEAILEKHLQSVKKFQNHKVEIVHLALGGYKQPQQLIQLNYLLSLGTEYDIVINLDGFNEMVHSVHENAAANVMPSFPRMWHAKIDAIRSQEERRLREGVTHAENQRQRNAAFFNLSPLKYSFLANLWWDIVDSHNMDHIAKQQAHYSKYLNVQKLSIERTGPFVPFEDHAALLDHCVQIWRRSSRMMNDVCKSNGITYFHCLQPNQYFEGSKVLTEEELSTAYDINHGYRQPAVDGYPLLVETGKKIREEGIPFLDLTQIFINEKGSVYSDACCHFLPVGDHIMAEAIGAFVAEHFKMQE